jgi:long-chain fatty acid transport protein
VETNLGTASSPKLQGTWRFFAGVQHALSVQEDIGFAAEYLRSDSNSDQSALVSGSYNQPQMFFLSANYPYQF